MKVDLKIKKAATKRKHESAIGKTPPEEVQKRTLEDFVEDHLSNGRSPKQIRAIAFNNSKWKGVCNEIFQMAEDRKNF